MKNAARAAFEKLEKYASIVDGAAYVVPVMLDPRLKKWWFKQAETNFPEVFPDFANQALLMSLMITAISILMQLAIN